MTTLKTFSKSEDALLLATFLSSAGIEAVVVDDNSLGGNLLGATKNAIRIELPENKIEEARTFLAEFESNSESLEIVEATSVTKGDTWYFDSLIIIELILLTLFFLFPAAFWITPPPSVQTYLDTQILSKGLWYNAAVLSSTLFPVAVISSILLFFRMKIGRLLFLGTLVWGALIISFLPPEILSPFGNLLSILLGLIEGAITAIMFLPPITNEFRKRLTDKVPEAS